ncbi:MAG TPA: hypothetical protein VG055_32570 [Planctomycetaceae bacterium]|jgi:hypothetical protein|nr:hypothetical protein [Planctomycetaceae bacterium]
MHLFWRILVIGSLFSAMASSLSVYPHSLGYLNELAGNPQNAYPQLVRINQDWGQGLIELERLLDEQTDWGPIAIAYTGPLDPEAIGIRAMPIDWGRCSPLAGFSHVVISANILAGSTATRGHVQPRTGSTEFESFFRQQHAVANLGGSLLIFEAAPFNDFCEKLHPAPGVGSHSVVASVYPAKRPIVPKLPMLADAFGANPRSIAALLHKLLLLAVCRTRSETPDSAPEVFRLLTDERLAKAAFGKSPFIRTRNGLRYRLVGRAVGDDAELGESHRDQCLATYAMLGYPLNEPIKLESETCTLRDLLSESVANFTFEQSELSFTAEAYARYLPPARNWTDRFGRTIDFCELACYLMDHDLQGQSCAGLHVVDAIAQIVDADYRMGILDPRTRIVAHRYLQQFLHALARNQDADGSWDTSWNRPIGAPGPPRTLSSQLLATGHVLEILHRLRPAPPPRLVARSTSWLIATLPRMKSDTRSKPVCPLTHCIRGVYLSFENRAMSPELTDLFSSLRKQE